MKLRPRILSLVIGILIVSFLALSIPLYWYTRSALEDELDKRLLSTAEIAAGNLSGDLLLNLTKEPAFSTVRFALEQELASFLVEGIEGLAIYSQRGEELAKWSPKKSDHPQISVLLQTFPVLRTVLSVPCLRYTNYPLASMSKPRQHQSLWAKTRPPSWLFGGARNS